MNLDGSRIMAGNVKLGKSKGPRELAIVLSRMMSSGFPFGGGFGAGGDGDGRIPIIKRVALLRGTL